MYALFFKSETTLSGLFRILPFPSLFCDAVLQNARTKQGDGRRRASKISEMIRGVLGRFLVCVKFVVGTPGKKKILFLLNFLENKCLSALNIPFEAQVSMSRFSPGRPQRHYKLTHSVSCHWLKTADLICSPNSISARQI